MNITTDNNGIQHENLSITSCIVESPKVLINEPSSPFRQTKAFNPFNFHDNINLAKPLSSKSYYSQIVDNKLLQTLTNGGISPNTSSYSFHSKSLYSPQIQSQSPKQYENVLAPTFQPSNKLTIVENTNQPVEVKKTKSKSKSKSESKSKKIIKIDSPKVNIIPSSPSQSSKTNNNNNNTSKSTDKHKVKQSKQKSKSNQRISSSSITPNADNINSRIVYPTLDLSSIFNDDDFYDSPLKCFKLEDSMNKTYIKNLKTLKPNLIPNVDSDELISLKDILLPSEMIKDIQLPKRKLELSSVVIINDSDNENEDSKDKSEYFSMNDRKKIKLEENENIPKIEIENEVDSSNNIYNNSNNNIKNVEDDIRRENFVDNIRETPFYTSYERFLDDCRSGKLVIP